MQLPLKIYSLHLKRNASFRLEVSRLTLQRGNILCLIGSNGSGKTTLLRCIAGLLKPDAGKILVMDKPANEDLKTTRLHLGYVPDDEGWIIRQLTAREYLLLLTNVYKKAGLGLDTQAHAMQLAELLYFTAFDQKLSELSHGNKKKVQLIAGMMHDPEVLIIDELRNGLDPLAIIAAEKILADAAKNGTCIIAATHDLWWAEHIASHIAMLVHGSIALSGTKAKLLTKYGNVTNAFIKVANESV